MKHAVASAAQRLAVRVAWSKWMLRNSAVVRVERRCMVKVLTAKLTRKNLSVVVLEYRRDRRVLLKELAVVCAQQVHQRFAD